MSFPIVILGSGRGSNAEALLRAERARELGSAKVVALVSDTEDAGILELGATFDVPALYLDPGRKGARLTPQAEQAYIERIRSFSPRLIVLAGFMRIIDRPFIDAFEGRVLNLHPSLLPSFPGLDGIGQAFRHGVKLTGCTVHWVTPALDAGPIIDQKAVRVEDGDTLETLAGKVHAAEHQLLPDVVARISREKIELRAGIDPGIIEALEAHLLETEQSSWGLMQREADDPFELFGIFPDEAGAEAALAELRADFPGLPETFARRRIEDHEWQNAYKAFVRPWSDRRLHWIPLWERGKVVLPEDAAVVYLDAGMAFGTGSHETTRLCARRLLDYLEEDGGRVREARVIDAGCGSGVLAFSAAALGFRDIFAFDNDPEAVAVCHANAAENLHLPPVGLAVADLAGGLRDRRADLLLANIETQILIPWADAIIEAVAPGGTLALSGILVCERDEIREHYTARCAALGREIVRTDSRTDGEWADVQIVLAG